MSNIYCPKGSVLIHYASPYYDPVKAHEYYMEHRKLKGRNFNDTGKEASDYVKKKLYEERDELINKHKERTDRGIENIRGAMDQRAKTLRENTNSDVQSISEKANAEKKRLSERTKEQIKSASAETKNKITNLRDELKGMSKTRRLLEKDRIQKEIDKLREQNSENRTKLQEELGLAKEQVSKSAKSESTKRRESGKADVDNVLKIRNEGVKEQRDTHTAYKKQIKEEYDKKYQSELDEMEKDASLVKAKKSSGSSKKTTKRQMK